MAKKTVETGEKVTCPYCGRPGYVGRVFANHTFDVTHKIGTKTFVGKVSGKAIKVESFDDGCSVHGKLGSDHWSREEEFEIEI